MNKEYKIRSVVVLIFLTIFLTTIYGAPYGEQHKTTKKDIFMSRGWGAAGMPFSMIYLKKYQRAQQKPKVVQHKATVRFSGEKAAAVRQQTSLSRHHVDTNHIPPQRTTENSRKNYTVPQLFVSYGWGPMGK